MGNCIKVFCSVSKFLLEKAKLRDGMGRRRAIVAAVMVFGAILVPLFVPSGNTHAAYRYGVNPLVDKVVARNLLTCYGNLSDRLTLSDFANRDIFDDGTLTVLMPNTIMNGTKTASPVLTCSEFLFGNDEWGGLINFTDYVSGDNLDYGKVDVLAQLLGYDRSSEGNDNDKMICISARADVTRAAASYKLYGKNQLCLTLREDPEFRNLVGVYWLELSEDPNYGWEDTYGKFTPGPRLGSFNDEDGAEHYFYEFLEFKTEDIVGDNTRFAYVRFMDALRHVAQDCTENPSTGEYCVDETQGIFDSVPGANFKRNRAQMPMIAAIALEPGTGLPFGEEARCSFLLASETASDDDIGASNVGIGCPLRQYLNANGEEANVVDALNNVKNRISFQDADASVEIIFDVPEVDFTTTGKPTAASVYVKSSIVQFVNRLNDKLGSSFGLHDFDRTFSQVEVYNLYAAYLANTDYVAVDCSGHDYGGMTSWRKLKLVYNGELTDCYVYEKVEQLYNGVNVNYPSYMHEGHIPYYAMNVPNLSLSSILDAFNVFYSDEFSIKDKLDELLDFANISNSDWTNPSTPDNPAVQPSVDVDSCYDHASGLGWMLCPILNLMSGAVEGIYEKYIEPALLVDSRLFSAGGNNGVYPAWSVFQGIANILFIVFLLIVIFSQLTGVGIDNYGVKKILPKLIIAAVLVNLSYWFCLACVDLSNILGNGLQNLFGGLGSGLGAINIEGVNLGGSEAGSGWLIAGIIAALAVGGWAVITNPAILLTLLVSILGVVIAVVFLFVLLSVREAAVVVLVVISPLAFACYMLPNTKKLFDKYVKLSEGLLLVYPIAGLLVGGGGYISRLLLVSGFASQGAMGLITAMIVGIVPVFFIPTVLKGSFAALGNLGTKISGIGQRIRGGAERGIRNSDRYRDIQKAGLERRARLRAGVDARTGELTKRGQRMANRASRKTGARGFYNRITGADRRRAMLITSVKKARGEEEAAGAELSKALATSGISSAEGLVFDDGTGGTGTLSGFGEHTEGAYYGRQFLAAAERGDTKGMNAAIGAMKKSSMKSKDIARLLRAAQNYGYFNRNMSDDNRASWMRSMFNDHNDILSTDFELKQFMRSGGSANGGALGNYGAFAAAHAADNPTIDPTDLNPEDVLKMSGDSIAGLAAAGTLSQGMAQRIMAMNPNLSEDKKIMLGALASGVASAATIGAAGGAEEFKNEAKALVTNRSAAAGTMSAEGGVTRSMIDAWVSATPQSVNVVQNFSGGGQQSGPVMVDGSLSVPHGPVDDGTSDGSGRRYY